MNPLFLQILTGVAVCICTVIVAFLISSLIEWYLHAKVLHGPEGTPPHTAHTDHHIGHQGKLYKIPGHEDDSFGLAPLMFVKVVLIVTMSALLVGYFTSYTILITVSAAMSSTLYFWTLGFVHKRLHIPVEGGWFETTKLYRALDKWHHGHHANDAVNFCILLPFVADWLFNTFSSTKSRKRTNA